MVLMHTKGWVQGSARGMLTASIGLLQRIPMNIGLKH